MCLLPMARTDMDRLFVMNTLWILKEDSMKVTTIYRLMLVIWLLPAMGLGQSCCLVPDTVGVDELKRNFYRWKDGTPSDGASLPHRMVNPDVWNNSVPVYQRDADIGRKSFYLAPSSPETLVKAGRIGLPASGWVVDECHTVDGLQRRLCWYGLQAPVQAGTDSVKLRRKLVRRYGEIPVSGVPASWYSGHFGVSSVADVYCNNLLCSRVRLYRVDKGFVTGDILLKWSAGSLSELHFYEKTISKVDWSVFIGDAELRHFSDMLQSVTGNRPVGYEGCRTYSFLLYTTQGKTRLHVLLPRQLTTAEQHLVGRLQQAVIRLPDGLFGYMLTADGRIFPARYLEGTFHPETNRWTFQDYLFLQPERR